MEALRHRRLEPAAVRAALHSLSTVRRRQLARTVPLDAQSPLDLAIFLPCPIRLKTCSASGSGVRRRSSASSFRHRADDDGGRKRFFINISFAACGTFRSGAAKESASSPAACSGMMSGSIISSVLTAGTMTIPTMKTGFRASYAAAIEACASTGAVLAPAGDGRDRLHHRPVPECQLRRGVALAYIIPAVLYYAGLFIQVDSMRRGTAFWA